MTTRATMEDRIAERGVVGDRHLVGVQTFDIARLTTHAVPIVPGTFVAVSGRGPKGDSNGSGKTSSLAAISVLLADPQWRLETNGGKWAAGLLFKPDAAGVDAGQHYPAASFGYVVGVFARHVDHSVVGTELADPLTVWVRIAATLPYVEARWQEGLQIADGATDLERVSQADLIWSGLPSSNRSSARRMAEVLYGNAPRCLSYLDTPLRKHSPSLLSQQMTEMTPEDIGQSLIALAGLAEPIEREEQQRGEVADHQRRLALAEADNIRTRADEDTDLASVAARDEARTQLAEGERMWRLHFAKRLVEVLAEDSVAAQRLEDAAAGAADAAARADTARKHLADLKGRTDLDEAEQQAKAGWEATRAVKREADHARVRAAERLGTLAVERAALLTARDGWSGASVEQATDSLTQAREGLTSAAFELWTAREGVAAAEEHLRRTRDGRDGEAGRAIDALATANIAAAALLDAVELDPMARVAWEPRLWPHRHAIVVAPGDEGRALDVLASLPGAELIVADAPLDTRPEAPPEGVRCTVPLAEFLHGLQQRHPYLPRPDRAEDPALGRAVLGGFEGQVAGRAARLARAESRLESARHLNTEADRRHYLSGLEVETADADLAAARAAARLDEIALEEGELRSRLPALDDALASAEAEEKAAQETWEIARDAAANHASLVQAASAEARLASTKAQQAREREAAARKARDELRIGYWQNGWGRGTEAARQALEEAPELLRRLTPKTLRNRAAEALRDALRAYGVTNADDAPDDLAEIIRRRDQLADGYGGVAGDTVDFTALARPLRNRLDGLAESDEITDSRIRGQRHARETALEALRGEVAERTGTLERLQDMIERLIEQHLSQVGEAFDQLDRVRDGYGASLRVTSHRPEGPTSHWRWHTVPCWRRSSSGSLTSYREVANGAQVKIHAIQLVLAALLASGHASGRVLVLDELGNSLGDVNKRDVLSSLQHVANQQQVTILGTCQDSVLEAAAEFCGEVLWYTHLSDAEPYNQPTRVWAFDPNGTRVELTADWIRSGRGYV